MQTQLGFGAGDSNLYSYVFNSPTNFTDPTGESAIGNGINAVLRNDYVYGTLNRADQFAAGFGSGATFGLTNVARSAIYRDGTARRNQSGVVYTVGNIAGDLTTSVVLTAATMPRRVRQAWQALDGVRTVIDVGRSVNNIYQDIRNECTETAGSFGDYVTIGSALLGVGVNARGGRNLADGAGSGGNSGNFGPLQFSQTTASRNFSQEGTFLGRPISSVADDLRSGTLTPNDVPVEVITRDRNQLIVNTRSSLALRQAGIPENQFRLVDRTGVPEVEARISERLARNGLDNSGTPVLRITGSGGNASTLR